MLDRMAGWTFGQGVRADTAVRYLWLNVLWLALSLTLIGAPAATVAMHAVVAEWANGDGRGVAVRFAAAIRDHWWRATATGLLIALVGAGLMLNTYIALHMGGVQRPVVLGLLCAASLALAFFAVCAMQVVSEGARHARGITRAAAHLGATHPFVAIAAIVLIAVSVAVAFVFPASLLVLPAPFVRLTHALRTRRRPTFTLPRTRIERTYA